MFWYYATEVSTTVVDRHGEVFNTGVTFKDILLWIPVLMTAVGAVMHARKASKKLNEVEEQVKTGNGKTAGQYLPHISEQLTQIQIDIARREEKTLNEIQSLKDSFRDHKITAAKGILIINDILMANDITDNQRLDLNHIKQKMEEESEEGD